MKLVRNDLKFASNINEFLVARDNRFKDLFDDALTDKDILLSDIVVSEQNNNFIVDLRVYYRTDAVLLYKQDVSNNICFKKRTRSGSFLRRLKVIRKIRRKKHLKFFKKLFGSKRRIKLVKRLIALRRQKNKGKKRSNYKQLFLKRLVGKNLLNMILLNRKMIINRKLRNYFLTRNFKQVLKNHDKEIEKQKQKQKKSRFVKKISPKVLSFVSKNAKKLSKRNCSI